MNDFTQLAFESIRYLSQTIGGRGSCTPNEWKASEYIADRLRVLGVLKIRTETFRAISSTYWPFTLAFAAALSGTLLVFLRGGRGVMFIAALLNALGSWGMLAEVEFLPHWGRWVLPKAKSRNVVGVIPPTGAVQERVVLSAHLDTHRTPIFFSSPAWVQAITTLVSLAFLSMIAGTIAFSIGAAFDWAGISWVGLGIIPIQAFVLLLCLHADLTPFSPGANDNASGVGVTLGLASRLQTEPLAHTEVHLVFTGCEEVGACGMTAYLDQHAEKLGKLTTYIILDEVGLGELKYLSADGLLIKHKTHPRALNIARQAAVSLPKWGIKSKTGMAFTDALVATRRGLAALTVCTDPTPKTGLPSHWHQMSDNLETIRSNDLNRTHDFVWEILQAIDRRAIDH